MNTDFSDFQSPEPTDRPMALALIIDLSNSTIGLERVLDVFKSLLIDMFSKMSYDNVLILINSYCENSGTAVAAISSYSTLSRNFSTIFKTTISSLNDMDRFYRRKLLLLTDRLLNEDIPIMLSVFEQNELRNTDIDFHVVGYGPNYSRRVSDIGWNYIHLDHPNELILFVEKVSN